MLIKDFATVVQGHQITDEEIYYSFGSIPIYTGSNDVKGFWDKSIITEDELPCISYPTKGNSGVTFIQTKTFDANNTALIIINDEYKNDIRLEWLAFALRPILKRYMTNIEGVSYLNKELVENIDLTIPDENIQKELIERFRIIEKSATGLRHILDSVDALLSKHLNFDISGLDYIRLYRMLSYISRNDALSEEGLYGIEKGDSQETIKVLSGSIEQIYYGEIPKDTTGIHFLDSRQGLHLVTRGQAGKLTYLKKDNYATNTNAFVLYLNDDIKEELEIKTESDEGYYLKFLKLYLEPQFIEISSSSDVSVFPLTRVFEDMEIPKFHLNDDIKLIVDKYDQLEAMKDALSSHLLKIESLFEKGIAY